MSSPGDRSPGGGAEGLLVTLPAVDLSVLPAVDRALVQVSAAANTPEAALVEKSGRCHHFLSTEDLPPAPQTHVGVVLGGHDVLSLQPRDGPGPASDAKPGPVTVTTVNVSVRAGAVGGDGELGGTATAGQTLLVVQPGPAQHFVH